MEDERQFEGLEDVIYEDEAVEVLSLGDENEPGIEELEDDLEDMEIYGEEEDSGNEGDTVIATFQPLRDDAFASFNVHKGPVFVVSIHPSSSLVVTGDQDDKAFVWNLDDQQIVFECTGHKDSVTSASFSYDGKYVCTGDLSGVVQVWLTSDGKCVWNFETSTIEWLLWHKDAHVLFAGTSDGDGWMWKIPSGKFKTFPSAGHGNMAGTILSDGKRACFGYFDGTLKIWNLKDSILLCSMTPPANQDSPVTCVSCHSDGSVILAGYMDGSARLISTSTAKLLATFFLSGPKLPEAGVDSKTSVESVEFAPSQHLALVAMVTGVVTAWDLSTQKLRYVTRPQVPEAGVVKLHISQYSPLFYTCHLDGVIRSWNLLSGECIREWHGHCASILDLAITREDSLLVSSSDDMTVRLYKNTDITSSLQTENSRPN